MSNNQMVIYLSDQSAIISYLLEKFEFDCGMQKVLVQFSLTQYVHLPFITISC